MFAIHCRKLFSKIHITKISSSVLLSTNRHGPIIRNFCIIPLEKTSFRVVNVRFKGQYNKNQQKDEDEISDDEDKDLSESKYTKIVRINVPSLRLDAIIKNSLGIARNKIDALFYESKIRVNGEKPLKKSITVQEEDEIDIIKGPDTKNPDLIYVARIEIVSMTALEESISIKIKRTKSLLIEDYDK